MGADAGVRCKDKETHARMLAFLKANMRPWHVVGAGGRWVLGQPHEGGDGTAFLRTGEDQSNGTGGLCWENSENVLGFDLGHDSPSREYTFGILRWIALKVGHLTIPETDEEQPVVRGLSPVPYIVYDGYEEWPVLRRLEWEGRVLPPADNWLVNEQGWKPYFRMWRAENRPDGKDAFGNTMLAQYEAEADDCDRLVSAELDRLDEIWNAQEDSK